VPRATRALQALPRTAPLPRSAALPPAAAAARPGADLVAGSQAEALVAARGTGTALPLWPDARQVALLPAAAFSPDVALRYGRAPDARLPGGIAP